MPFKSEKQRRYMHANLPEIAQRWERDYASGGIARAGYQQGNWVAPFYNTNVMQGSVIPPDMGTYNYQHPRGTDIIGMDEMNTYGQLPMGTDTIGMNEMFSYQNPQSIYAPYGMGPKGNPYKNPRTIGQQVYAASDPYGNKQMNLEKENFYNSPQGLAFLRNKMGNAWSGVKNFTGNVMDKATGIFSGAKNKGGALMGNILGMATGIPFLGQLLGNIRPDNPYEKFQKQMFSEMYGGHNFGNKDPFGKNIRSAFGNYDVIEQADKFMNSKLGQKRGFKEVMADGIITQDEIEQYGLDKMGSWQLNRLRTLAAAKKKALGYKKKISDALALKEKQKEARKIKNRIRRIETEPRQDPGGGQGWQNPETPGIGWGQTHSGPVSNKTGRGRQGWSKGGLASLWPK